jgi:sulfide:quinone oxidoreductase
VPGQAVRALDPARHVAILDDGRELPYDLFLGIPVHRAPAVVEESGLCVDGWIPVDPLTLETTFPDVYAVGDVTSVGTPKAGVFAEGQAVIVADAIIARQRDAAAAGTYGGRGLCYIEFGEGEVARVDVTFLPGQPPSGHYDGASLDFAADKAEFGSSRVRRWFDREWTNT